MIEKGICIFHLHFSFFTSHFSFKLRITMSKKVNAKKEAYAKKQEEKGRNLIMWIIGVLIALGVLYAFWASFMMS